MLCYYTPRTEHIESDGVYPMTGLHHDAAEPENNVAVAIQKFMEKNTSTELSVLLNPSIIKSGSIAVTQTALPDFWRVDRFIDPIHTSITSADFKPGQVHSKRAAEFYEKWRAKVVKPFDHSYPIEDFVLIALTEDLQAPKKYQGHSSFEMIEDVLEMEPERQIIIRLPDGVKYPTEDMARLIAYDFHERITFSQGAVDRLLDACAYVVTQNSPVSIKAAFHGKNVIQYARSEFHHIFQKVYAEKRLKRCFNRVLRDRPDYEKYVYWFFGVNCIDAGSVGGTNRIIKALTAITAQ